MALPADWSMVPVSYHPLYLDGTQPTGTLEITASFTRILDDDATDPVWIVPKTISVPLNSSGPTTFSLPATDDPDISQQGWTYQCVEKFTTGGGTTFTFQTPIASLPGGVNLGRVGIVSGNPSVGTLVITFGVVRNGVGAPNNSMGNDNDFYIDTTPNANKLYGPKLGGSWPSQPIALGGASDPATATHAATSKTTPADADELPLIDSAASFGLKKLTWANLKAAVKSYLDGTGIAKLTTPRNIDGVPFDGTGNITVIAPATHASTAKTTPVAADELAIMDSAASFGLKRSTIANFKAAIFASPAFTGTPTAPTQSAGDSSTNVATTEYVDDAVAPKLDAAGAASAGIPQVRAYNTGTSSWPSDPNYTNAAYAFIFIGGDDAHAPPIVANTAQSFWIEP
jgi:hypothetical protein